MDPVPLYHVWHYTNIDRAFWREHLESWLPQRVFDAHTHVIEPRFRLVALTEEKRREHWVNEALDPISAADVQRCQSLVLPEREFSCLCFGSVDLDFDIEGEDASLQTECVRRGWYRLAQVRPQWSAERIAWELDQPGVIGAKVYYTLIGNDPTSCRKHIEASIFDFLPHHQLELLDQRHAWVTLHVPKADRLSHPANIAEIQEIRRKYPNIILVIAHLGRCYTLPHAEEAFPHFADDEGLYFDTSAVLNPDVHRLALQMFGPGRILYGSDNPIFYMRGRRQFKGRSYINRTSYPFYFNHVRESADIEAMYTLYMYEDLRAIRQACEEIALDRTAIESIFHENAFRLINSVLNRRIPCPS